MNEQMNILANITDYQELADKNRTSAIKYGAKDYYPHQPMHLVADIKDLTKDTGWKPVWEFNKGLERIN